MRFCSVRFACGDSVEVTGGINGCIGGILMGLRSLSFQFGAGSGGGCAEVEGCGIHDGLALGNGWLLEEGKICGVRQ